MFRCESCGIKINFEQIELSETIECLECGVDHIIIDDRLTAIHLGPSEE
jgi:hypothetical protein